MVVAGVIWTYWVTVLLALATGAVLLAILVGFFVKSVSIKYPPGEIQRRIQDALRRR